ncbi:MAG: hypothetical protein HOW97_28520 [Catenulispora sp.]|nr:hypothetical protein [Catenulispora sp.]
MSGRGPVAADCSQTFDGERVAVRCGTPAAASAVASVPAAASAASAAAPNRRQPS